MSDDGLDQGMVTRLLQRVSDGDAKATGELYQLVYQELHRIARAHMARQSPEHTLQPTALVHEAWIRLVELPEVGSHDRDHFLSVASRAMRTALVDHARRRRAEKRGGDRERFPLDAAIDAAEAQGMDVVALNDLLEALAGREPQTARLVELRFFGGLSMEETASVMGMSLSSAERLWRGARLRLAAALGG